MRYGVQDLVVALVALAALGWLVWRRVRVRRGAAAAACPDCPVAVATPGTRPAPMPTVRPTAEGQTRLARRGSRLITIAERKAATRPGVRP